MRLTDDRLPQYVHFLRPDDGEVARREVLERVRGEIARGERSLDELFVAENDAGTILAALRFKRTAESRVYLLPPFGSVDAAAGLLPEVCEATGAGGFRTIDTRVPAERMTSAYEAALRIAGFVLEGERVEYETKVETLPDETGTPLTWQDLSDVGFEAAARLLGEAVRGALDWPEDQDPAEILAGYLEEPDLTTSPDCVQFGSLDGEPAVVVIAQVAPRDGWSRVTYLAVRPEFRGRGLGKWAHRRGATIMRKQGGKTYCGGTRTDNPAMIRLFVRHGSTEVARMTEWSRTGTPAGR
jgi:ribosomal protein S18 acetylase RimI-like enzyme